MDVTVQGTDINFEDFDLFDVDLNFDLDSDWTDFEALSSESQSRSESHSPINTKEKRSKVVKSRSRPNPANTIVDVLKHQPLTKRRHNRKQPIALTLYAFPSFDRCDSLLFFPNSLMRYLNTCDYSNMSKLFNSYLDKRCTINLSDEYVNIRSKDLLCFYQLLNDLFPDQIACVYDTKVVENKITTSIFVKCTACKSIIESVAQTAKENMFAPTLCHYNVKDHRCMGRSVKPERLEEIQEVINQHDNMIVYMKVDVVITFDDYTKKIVAMHFEPRVQSMNINGAVYDFYQDGVRNQLAC